MKWEKVKLGSVTDSCLGKMLDQNKNKGDYQPYLANVNVRWGEFDLEDLPLMKFEESEQERYELKYGDLVICEGGEPGRCAIWKEQIPNMKIQKALHRVRVHDCLDYRYLFYWFLLAGKTGELDQYFTGATIKHMPGQKLKEVVIDKPPLEIQHRIADILSAYDDLIENNQKQIKLLEEAAQRLYKEWFMDLRFPGHENTKIVEGVPEGWSRTNINEILTFHRGYDLTKNEMKAGRYPVVGSTTVIGYHNEFKIKGPGIVTGRSGSLGKYQFIWDNFWPHNTSLYISDYKDHNIFFVYSLLQTVDFASLNNGGAIPTLNRNVLSNIEVIEPTDELQEMFAKIAEAQYRKIRNLEKQNNQLKMARDVLLPKLMSGEVEV
ncbi:restriction endonuclease subunit S [Faecalibacterium prausnitzii]|uniref:Type I restriction modification DNA specificity domain-containing protein n=1 Tax=Faecalibacterium prausnitzii TaxID=853 RepID=A0A2A7ARA8_9FIRM|nr:restriction endonuclease subunit S [Faecalibacterium prausnitzii]PDX81677.1 hypothetical protein CGS58_06275 [Faecalibacterium prausnitzii]